MSALQIDDLRKQLQQKFPSAHKLAFARKQASPPRAVESLDFESGHLSEVVSGLQSSGISLVLADLLRRPLELPLALIDAHDSFDPSSYPGQQCSKVLWLRCRKTTHAIQCADLLLRDGNLPLVVLDLHLACDRELRQVPLATWKRFKNEARASGTAFVALTPRPFVPTPHRRFTSNGSFTLDHLELRRPRASFVDADQIQNPQRIAL